MFDALLRRMRHQIRAGRYVMTLHAEEEMDEDNLSIFDVETVFLTGKIVRRQRDSRTGEWKYLVKGQATLGARAGAAVIPRATKSDMCGGGKIGRKRERK
jgi:hypothetical protein